MEQSGIPRDVDDGGIDLIIVHRVGGLGAADEAAGPEPDHRIADRAGLAGARHVHDLGHGGAVVVVHQDVRPAADRIAVLVANALGAVQRGAVAQDPKPAVLGIRHPADAEEAAHRDGAVLVHIGVIDGEDHRDGGGERQGGAPEQHGHRQEGADDPVEPGFLVIRMKSIERDQDQHRHGERAERDIAALPAARQRKAGPAERRQHDQDRIFRDPVEHMGRDQAGRDAADHPAGRHPEIEDGEMACGRPPARELAVADQRVDEEYPAMQTDDPDDVLDRIEDQDRDQSEDEERLQRDREPVRDERRAAGTRSRRSGDRARAAAPRAAARRPRRSRYGPSPRSGDRPERPRARTR